MVYAIAAVPIGKPGWPELAFCTPSAERKRRVLIARACKSAVMSESCEKRFFTILPNDDMLLMKPVKKITFDL
jgi:hypothetical protein